MKSPLNMLNITFGSFFGGYDTIETTFKERDCFLAKELIGLKALISIHKFYLQITKNLELNDK